MKARPNLFLIGAMKAGTTALASWLARSEAVFVPLIKEPNHFSRELIEAGIADRMARMLRAEIEDLLASDPHRDIFHAYIDEPEHYLALYADSNSFRYRLDASTTYLNSPVAAGLIHDFSPDARVIAITREPAARAWSEFLMCRKIGLSSSDWKAALDREWEDICAGRTPLAERYVSTGLYEEHLDRFRRLFGAQLLELDFDDLVMRADIIRDRVSRFLEIEDLPVTIERENSAVQPRFARLNTLLHRSGVKYWLRDNLPSPLGDAIKKAFYSDRAEVMPGEFARIVKARLEQLASKAVPMPTQWQRQGHG